jgi:uncharacterized membrane protein
MTLYEFLLFVHVLAVAAWVGGAIYPLLVSELALRARDQEQVVRLLQYDEKLGPIFFIPAGLIVLGAGIWLVVEGNWSMTEDAWTLAGLIALVLAFAIGIAFFLPAGKRLNESAAQFGAGSAEVRQALDRLRVVAWIDVLVLVFAVFVMTTKPF